MRLQKERDVVGQEAASLREKLELVQSQVAKATRDRELLLSETESSRERFDKVNQNLLKIQVRLSDLYLLFSPLSLHHINQLPDLFNICTLLLIVRHNLPCHLSAVIQLATEPLENPLYTLESSLLNCSEIKSSTHCVCVCTIPSSISLISFPIVCVFSLSLHSGFHTHSLHHFS